MKRFVLTCGDINGIGPEIAIKALNKLSSKKKKLKFTLIIPENIFFKTSQLIKPKFKFEISNNYTNKTDQIVQILTLKTYKQNIGKPTDSSGEAAYEVLKTSFKLLQGNLVDAVVTAPISKTALKIAGIKKYPGQTEMFADWCGVKNFVMTFLSKKLRVSLYSIHIPLKEVPNSLYKKDLLDKLNILYNMLRNDLGLKKPKIAVLGLNPHAGENGVIGDEEKRILIPALKQKKISGFTEGPFSSDAFFAKRKFEEYDMIFGLYHDQVLIPFKYINSGKGVNYTAGLPIIRTSPDHGVAYDIAGKGIADENSLIEAIKYAELILDNRTKLKKN
jgi:4-hydroxythreonine-4-phosphate dehydrogenase